MFGFVVWFGLVLGLLFLSWVVFFFCYRPSLFVVLGFSSAGFYSALGLPAAAGRSQRPYERLPVAPPPGPAPKPHRSGPGLGGGRHRQGGYGAAPPGGARPRGGRRCGGGRCGAERSAGGAGGAGGGGGGAGALRFRVVPGQGRLRAASQRGPWRSRRRVLPGQRGPGARAGPGRRAGGCAERSGRWAARSSLLGGRTGASCGVSSRVSGVGTWGNRCVRGPWGTAPSPGELGQGNSF